MIMTEIKILSALKRDFNKRSVENDCLNIEIHIFFTIKMYCLIIETERINIYNCFVIFYSRF